jgi:hypothetical protein
MPARNYRIYVTFRSDALDPGSYTAMDPNILKDLLPGLQGEFRVEGFPSLKFPPRSDSDASDAEADPLSGLNRLILSLSTDDPHAIPRIKESNIPGLENVGADPGYGLSDHWCPASPPDDVFGDRAMANQLIGRQALIENDLIGRGVNVVVVDHGLDRERIRGRFGGGWVHRRVEPGLDPISAAQLHPGQLVFVKGVTNNDHGMMIARNILEVAPGAIIHDCPLIPPRITDVPMLLSDAEAALNRILADVRAVRARWDASWILVNAWAIFNRTRFEFPLGDYTENAEHPFNRLIDEVAAENIDLVFPAGNSGQFCPDRRSGPYDVGPGASIHGANGHKRTLTVGAVRTDGIWIGSSSQGPGLLERDKPDLCAPSEFSEINDRHETNGGTSAACAMAAGVLAALRERKGSTQMSPEAMRQVLRTTARRIGPPAWDERFGYGIIDAGGALASL